MYYLSVLGSEIDIYYFFLITHPPKKDPVIWA